MPYYAESEAGALREAFEEIVRAWPGVTMKKMFGAPSYTAGGTLFAVMVTGGIILTCLSEEEKASLRKDPAADYFIGHGRVITKWVQIALRDPVDLERYLPFIKASYRAARERPEG